MKIKWYPAFFGALFLTACGESAPASETPTQETVVESEPEIQAEVYEEKTLPGLKGIELKNDDYIITEILAFIESEENAGQNLSVVLTEDDELYLEVGYDKSGKDESWYIDIPVDNSFGLEVKLEYTDANHDDVKDELVIWWYQGDNNNGIESGYEIMRNGVIIFDVIQRQVMVNLEYENYYATYQAGADANLDDPDYHAKSAEDTEWFICGYGHKVQLKDGELILSDYYRDTEGEGECVLLKYAEGTYTYNYSSGLFEHESQKVAE